jgi:hypothetical protein
VIVFAERRQFGDAGLGAGELAPFAVAADACIKGLAAGIHFTNDIGHDSLSSPCDWDRATVRSFVTMRLIPNLRGG